MAIENLGLEVRILSNLIYNKLNQMTMETENLSTMLKHAVTEKQILLAEKEDWAIERDQLLAQINTKQKLSE